ncbi:MAG: DUF4350 domain-containing protein [Bacteroidales bacterium]
MKNKKIPISYILLLLLGIGLVIFLESRKQKSINWSKTYSCRDAIPFGTDALFELIPGLFPGQSIQRINQTFYDYYREDSSTYNVMYICENFQITEESQKSLLRHASKGNTVFISASEYSTEMLNKFGIKVSHKTLNKNNQSRLVPYTVSTKTDTAIIDTLSWRPLFKMLRPGFKPKPDTSVHHQVLGWLNFKLPNFLHIAYGKGNIYLHSEPLVFTNYYLLRGNSAAYCKSALKHIPVNDLIWSDFPNKGYNKSSSPLRYISSQKSLKTGYYLLLITMLIFILTGGRRRQRPVPVIHPPENNSLEFLYNLRNLYLHKNDHKTIAQHLIKDLKITLKDNYSIKWNPEAKAFREELTEKTGITENEARELGQYIRDLQEKNKINAQTLFALNTIIEKIKKI